MLNKQKGNMYPWVTHTWNIVKGKCPHDCEYCYMKLYPQKDIRFDVSELKTDLGRGNTIFAGSSCDPWAEAIPQDWLIQILKHCYKYPNNTYLFQSKNPSRFELYPIPVTAILGTTIETNRHIGQFSKAPSTEERMRAMVRIKNRKMVSIEPIMDFDLAEMVIWVRWINPEFISIGADSKGHNLPEPPADKIKQLIEALKEITEVKIKDNLKRLSQ